MKNIYCVLAAAANLIFSTANGTTDRYRIMWRDDPSTTMVIGWNQRSGSNPVVFYSMTDYGTDYSRYPNSRRPDRSVVQNGMNNHFVRLTGLKPNTAYYFVIRDSEGVSRRFWFRTAPGSPDNRLSVIAGGDSRDSRVQRQNANKLVSKLRPHVVLFGGDMTRSNHDYEWQDWFSDWQLTTGADGRMIPILVARGNHESSDAILVNHFDVPHDNVYYALNFGGSLLRVYTLNSETSIAGDQTTWLTRDLTANGAIKWKIAQYHRPMRPHVSSKSEGNNQYRYWASLFHQHRMNVVIECDAHTVKSTWPIVPSNGPDSHEGFVRNDSEGTVYLGEGCWGAPLRTNDDDKPWTRNSGMFNQFNWIIVSANKIEARVVKTDNADEVGTVDDADIFRAPANLDIWNPSNGAVITITAPEADRNVMMASASPAAGSDDAEERADGTIYVGSTDLELVYDNTSTGNQTVGIRFPTLDIPQGAVVEKACIQFTSDENGSGATSLNVYGEDLDDSPPFTTSRNNISSRTRVSSSIAWTPAPWTTLGQRSVDQQSPDLSEIVQHIVNREGWKPGNAMTFILTGSGKRTASAFEKSPDTAPVLNIVYRILSKEETSSNQSLMRQINKGIDDVEQRSDGSVYVGSTDLELVYDNSTTGNQMIGLRFESLDMPGGSLVTSAYIQFSSDETGDQHTHLNIHGEANDDPKSFSYATNNVSSRPRTMAYVEWHPDPWNTSNQSTPNERSPDLKDIVQEIINRPGWKSGNAMSFIVTGTGKRTAWSYEGSPAQAPKLIINYMESAGVTAASTRSEDVISDVYKRRFRISPNPVSDLLSVYVQRETWEDDFRCQIFTSGGVLCRSVISRLKGDALELNVHDLPAGIYLLRISSHSGAGVLRFAKE